MRIDGIRLLHDHNAHLFIQVIEHHDCSLEIIIQSPAILAHIRDCCFERLELLAPAYHRFEIIPQPTDVIVYGHSNGLSKVFIILCWPRSAEEEKEDDNKQNVIHEQKNEYPKNGHVLVGNKWLNHARAVCCRFNPASRPFSPLIVETVR